VDSAAGELNIFALRVSQLANPTCFSDLSLAKTKFERPDEKTETECKMDSLILILNHDASVKLSLDQNRLHAGDAFLRQSCDYE
jgi:hypothetical protein